MEVSLLIMPDSILVFIRYSGLVLRIETNRAMPAELMSTVLSTRNTPFLNLRSF